MYNWQDMQMRDKWSIVTAKKIDYSSIKQDYTCNLKIQTAGCSRIYEGHFSEILSY
jgi:hypothetical protein